MRIKAFKVGTREIGEDGLFFTIEEGMANLGNYDKALRMVDAASMTGADAIEFQLVVADDLYASNHPGHIFCSKCEFSNLQIADLVAYAKSKGMEFLAVPLSHKLIEPLVNAGCSGFNINASDINNPDIIDAVSDSGLPFFLSTLMASEEEIEWAVKRIYGRSSPYFAILHGQHTMMSSELGVDVAHTALGYIRTLKSRYQVPVGFIDHTWYAWMPAAAVSAGADSVSKHMALSRDERGPDWQVCLEPDEMKEAVFLARELRKSIISRHKVLVPGEVMDRAKMRRSIVASKSLKSGQIIKRGDVEFKRPGLGIEPSKYEGVVGKMIICNLDKNELIRSEDLKEV